MQTQFNTHINFSVIIDGFLDKTWKQGSVRKIMRLCWQVSFLFLCQVLINPSSAANRQRCKVSFVVSCAAQLQSFDTGRLRWSRLGNCSIQASSSRSSSPCSFAPYLNIFNFTQWRPSVPHPLVPVLRLALIMARIFIPVLPWVLPPEPLRVLTLRRPAQGEAQVLGPRANYWAVLACFKLLKVFVLFDIPAFHLLTSFFSWSYRPVVWKSSKLWSDAGTSYRLSARDHCADMLM